MNSSKQNASQVLNKYLQDADIDERANLIDSKLNNSKLNKTNISHVS